MYDARWLAARGDIVVVTLNYRLGALGFLAHPGAGAGGRGRATTGWPTSRPRCAGCATTSPTSAAIPARSRSPANRPAACRCATTSSLPARRGCSGPRSSRAVRARRRSHWPKRRRSASTMRAKRAVAIRRPRRNACGHLPADKLREPVSVLPHRRGLRLTRSGDGHDGTARGPDERRSPRDGAARVPVLIGDQSRRVHVVRRDWSPRGWVNRSHPHELPASARGDFGRTTPPWSVRITRWSAIDGNAALAFSAAVTDCSIRVCDRPDVGGLGEARTGIRLRVQRPRRAPSGGVAAVAISRSAPAIRSSCDTCSTSAVRRR